MRAQSLDRSVVLRVEPANTVLELAATLTIFASQVGASTDDGVIVYSLNDGAWRVVPSAERNPTTGDITLSVTRFDPIGVSISTPGTGGTISGTISWGDGSPTGMAPVELMLGSERVATTQTDATGAFSFSGLAAGTYRVVVDYECMIDQSVVVTAGMSSPLTLTLCGG